MRLDGLAAYQSFFRKQAIYKNRKVSKANFKRRIRTQYCYCGESILYGQRNPYGRLGKFRRKISRNGQLYRIVCFFKRQPICGDYTELFFAEASLEYTLHSVTPANIGKYYCLAAINDKTANALCTGLGKFSHQNSTTVYYLISDDQAWPFLRAGDNLVVP